MKLVIHYNLQGVVVVLGLFLQHALVAPTAIGIDSSVIRLKVSGYQDRLVGVALRACHLLGVPRGRGQEINIALPGMARHAKLGSSGRVTLNKSEKGHAHYEGNDKHTDDRQEV